MLLYDIVACLCYGEALNWHDLDSLYHICSATSVAI
jgi:hypothetical protein